MLCEHDLLEPLNARVSEVLRYSADRLIVGLLLRYTEELISFFIKDPHDLLRLTFDEALVKRSLAEAANLSFKVIIQEDANLKAAVMISALED